MENYNLSLDKVACWNKSHYSYININTPSTVYLRDTEHVDRLYISKTDNMLRLKELSVKFTWECRWVLCTHQQHWDWRGAWWLSGLPYPPPQLGYPESKMKWNQSLLSPEEGQFLLQTELRWQMYCKSGIKVYLIIQHLVHLFIYYERPNFLWERMKYKIFRRCVFRKYFLVYFKFKKLRTLCTLLLNDCWTFGQATLSKFEG